MGDFTKIMLDAGVLTYNNGTTDVEIGFTRGGSFNDNYTLREIEVDGKRFPIVGDRVLESAAPTLDFNVLQMSSALLEKVFAGVAVSGSGETTTLTRAVALADTDYLTNVTWTGMLKNGKTAKIILTNALGVAPMNFEFADKGEVQIPCQFLAHSDSVDDTTLPYSLVIDESI